LYVAVARVLAAGACVALAIVAVQCEKHFDRTNPVTGDRTCADEPAEIGVWSFDRHPRRPEEAVNLQTWIVRHPDRIHKRYGPSCETPLHFAAQFGREDLAALLIAAGADVDAPDEYDDRPLHAAATYGRASVVALLLTRGADVHARGAGGKTALHAAASAVGAASGIEARLEVAKLLLAAGADVNARQPHSGVTPLRYAAASETNRSTAMAELLLTFGADPGGAGSQGPPLVNVAMAGNIDGLELLLDRGADVNAAGLDCTALGGAAYGGHVEIVRILLDRGAAVDRRVRGSTLDWDGLPLAMALVFARWSDSDVMNRRRDAARLILRRGADADARNRAGETLVHRTASEGDAAAVDLLLSFGAQVSARDAAGFTPLHAAARHGQTDAAMRLLSAGASAHARAADGSTPLDLTVGNPRMTALLRRAR
jgi:ankyrin repeat protein